MQQHGWTHKDNVEWKNPGTKEDILYNSIYVKLKKTGKNKLRLRDVQLGIKVKRKPISIRLFIKSA